MLDTKLFYDTLFDPEDNTCFGNLSKPEGRLPGIYSTRLVPVSAPAGQALNYLVINPMHTKRNVNNVTKFRNVMIEMDETSLTEQWETIKASGLPFSTSVYSGGKSIHFIVSLDVPLESKEAYQKMTKKLYAAMEAKSSGIDLSNKNASRFSRTPNTFRHDKGKTQKLIEVRGRIPNAIFNKWIDDRFELLGILHEDFEPKIIEKKPVDPNSVEMDDRDKYKWVKKYYLKGETMPSAGRWQFLFKAASGCNIVGLSEATAASYMDEFSGFHGDREITTTEIERQVTITYRDNRSDHGQMFLAKPMSKKEYKAMKNKEREAKAQKYKLPDSIWGYSKKN